MRVLEFNQRDLLGSAPAFELLLSADCLLHIVERFPVQQTLDIVFVSEACDAMELVLENALGEITGHAYVESSCKAAHDVRAVGFSVAVHGVGALRLR